MALLEGPRNLRSLSASQFEQFMLSQKMILEEEIKQNEQNMKYKIFSIKDFLTEIKYEGVRKGTKTEAYLEDVIKSINKSKKYRWVQFFQLVDVFYVVVEDKTKTTKEEIQDHYKYEEPTVQEVVETVEKAANMAGEAVGKITKFPWQTK